MRYASPQSSNLAAGTGRRRPSGHASREPVGFSTFTGLNHNETLLEFRTMPYRFAREGLNHNETLLKARTVPVRVACEGLNHNETLLKARTMPIRVACEGLNHNETLLKVPSPPSAER